MTILEEINHILLGMDVPVETGVFTDEAPETYVVLTPLSDVFDLHTDDTPGMDVQEVRLSIFTKGSYTQLKNRIVRSLLQEGFTITDRRYIGFETDTRYHHYAVDTAKAYEYTMEETHGNNRS